MKFRLAALRMSSTPIRMPTALRRVMTVTMPRAKSTAPTTRKWGRPMLVVISIALVRGFLDLLARDHDRADQRCQQDHRGDLERQQVFSEEGDAETLRGGG